MSDNKILYCRDELLGKGGQGAVFKGTYLGNLVAVKRVELFPRTAMLTREEEALKQLNHPFVVSFYHAEDQNEFRCYALELCAASLKQVFMADETPLKYQVPPELTVLYQLASGLEFIHWKNLVHRDIKPGNVLVSLTTPVVMKWADFGLSRTVNERGTFTMDSTIRGSAGWFAPEVLEQISSEEERNQPRGTTKSDVFVAGCLFAYFLLKGKHPFGKESYKNYEIEKNIMSENAINLKELPSNHYTWNILSIMLTRTPETRSTMEQVVKILRTVKLEKQGELFRLCCTDGSITGESMDELGQLVSEIGLDWMERDVVLRYGNNLLLNVCKNCKKNDLPAIVRSIVSSSGVDVNCKDLYGNNALLNLCWNYPHDNLIDLIRLLIDSGIDINCMDRTGNNALMILCGNYKKDNLLDVVRLLVLNGIDTSSNNRGDNALTYLRKRNCSEDLVESVERLIMEANQR